MGIDVEYQEDFGKMGFLGIKTKKDREHEMALQKEAQEHDERMQRDFFISTTIRCKRRKK